MSETSKIREFDQAVQGILDFAETEDSAVRASLSDATTQESYPDRKWMDDAKKAGGLAARAARIAELGIRNGVVKKEEDLRESPSNEPESTVSLPPELPSDDNRDVYRAPDTDDLRAIRRAFRGQPSSNQQNVAERAARKKHGRQYARYYRQKGQTT